MAAVPTLKSFISEKELEEVRKKKQEEWEKVRKPDQPLQRPEEEYDSRTLFERLKAQRDRKQEEWEEQFKFKNMIYKGLDEDESAFLQFVVDRQIEQEDEVVKNEIQEVSAYREAVLRLQEEKELHAAPQSTTNHPQASSDDTSNKPTKILGTAPPKTQKSQLSLIAGSIKTKRKRSMSQEERTEKAAASPEKKLKLDDVVKTSADTPVTRPTLVTLLPGLAAYSSSDSSEPED